MQQQRIATLKTHISQKISALDEQNGTYGQLERYYVAKQKTISQMSQDSSRLNAAKTELAQLTADKEECKCKINSLLEDIRQLREELDSLEKNNQSSYSYGSFSL